MKREQISSRQLWFILFIIRSTIFLAYMPLVTAADACQDAWISGIIVLIGSELIVFLIALLTTRFPGLTLIEYSQKLLGKWVGKLLGLLFFWLFLQNLIIDIRFYGEVIISSFLPNTPLIFINGMMILTASICIYTGIEILGRITDFMSAIFILMIVAVLLIPLPYIDMKNLQPVFACGPRPVIRGTLTPVALISQAWILGMLTPVIDKNRKALIISLTSIGLSLLILIIFSVIIIGTLGPQETARANFPLLYLIRAVKITEFFQRTEALVMVAWGFGVFISISTFLYCGAKGLAQIINLQDHRSIIWPISIICLFMSIQGFKDIFAFYDFLKFETFAPFKLSVYIILPLVLLWSGYFVRIKFSNKIGD